MSSVVVPLLSVLVCLLSAATAAGLTLGVLSLDELKLKIKEQTGTETEKAAVKAILPLLKDRHFLMCTLLLFNSLANEALPVFLNEIVPSFVAIIISVTLVLLVGEVMPAAIFTGPNQLNIAYKLTGVLEILQIIFYPIAYPMARGLDAILGSHEEGAFNRDELSVLMSITRDSALEYHEKRSLQSQSMSMSSGGDSAKYSTDADDDKSESRSQFQSQQYSGLREGKHCE
jgi:CBS domain containing-hemolysin-like protein